MPDGDEDDFGSVYEVNSRRSHLSAYVLVAGLVLELFNATIWYKGSETLAEMAAVLLIVGGVWGEIFFGRKARIAGDKQLVQYEARAAEAKLELAKFRAPRMLTTEQRGRIVDKLKQFSGTEYDITISGADPEILNFVFIIEIILSTAGWAELNWQGDGETLIRQEGQSLIRIGVSITNVVIGAHVDQPPKFLEFAQALSDALVNEGITATSASHTRHKQSSTNKNAIHIMIGRKM